MHSQFHAQPIPKSQKVQTKNSSNQAKTQGSQQQINQALGGMQNGSKATTPADILIMQQTVGNKAVSQMLGSNQESVARKDNRGAISAEAIQTKKKSALDDKAKSIKEKLSYGLLDWAVTDAEARDVIKELAAMSDGSLQAMLGKLGSKHIGRLLDNLSAGDRKKYASTVVRVIRLGGTKNALKYIKKLLSYGLFDWAITDTDTSKVLEVFDAYPASGFLGLIKKIGTKYWVRLLTNLPDDQAKKLVDRFARALNTLLPTTLGADKSIIGSAQTARAIAKYKALEVTEQVKFHEILDKATSESEQRYIYKALAAGYGLADVAAFAGKIRGKGDKWRQNNLRLTEDTKGGGIKQQWSHTCNIRPGTDGPRLRAEDACGEPRFRQGGRGGCHEEESHDGCPAEGRLGRSL